jgi:hypothetical protein
MVVQSGPIEIDILLLSRYWTSGLDGLLEVFFGFRTAFGSPKRQGNNLRQFPLPLRNSTLFLPNNDEHNEDFYMIFH